MINRQGMIQDKSFTKLIHSADPQSRPVVITIFTNVLCLYIYRNRAKHNHFPVRIVSATSEIVGLAEGILLHFYIFAAQRDVSDLSNKITYYVPIHLMNVDLIKAGLTREIAFGLTIGDKKLWSGLKKFTIQDAVTNAAATPVSVTVIKLNAFHSSPFLNCHTKTKKLGWLL